MTTRGRGEADYVGNFLVAKVEEVQVAADLCKVGCVCVRARRELGLRMTTVLMPFLQAVTYQSGYRNALGC